MGSQEQFDPRTRNLRVLSAGVVASAIADIVKNERAAAFETLRKQYDETGATNAVIRLPDGTKIASLTLTIPEPRVESTDEAALIAWVEEHYPTEVEYVAQIRPAFLTALMGRIETGDDGSVFDPALDGLLVDGLQLKDAAEPSSFSTRWTKKDESLAKLQALLGRDEIAALLEGSPLAIGTTIAPETAE